MPSFFRSSRRRFGEYRKRMLEDRKAGLVQTGGWHDRPDRQPKKKRTRSFWVLFQQFWGLLAGNRRLLIFAMTIQTLGVIISMVPIAAPKFILDNVIGQKPLPAWFPYQTTDRVHLLTFIVISMVLLSVIAAFSTLWARWNATRMTKRTQLSVRRRVFSHVVKLPLHRVYEIKSGGVASILRDDAGGSGDLVFSMLYNPWGAIVRLLVSLSVLLTTDWRLLMGFIMLPALVWYTHRQWIGRIRPIHRDTRFTRQGIDAHATEAFGGMRVVRSFSRQRAETGTFARGTDFMARQEILAWWMGRGIDLAWELILPLATALLFYFGGKRVLDGRLSTGSLMMFLTYLMSLLGPIGQLVGSATQLQGNLAGLDRVLDILNEGVEMPDRPGAKVVHPETVDGRITLRDVTFKYPGNETPVLDAINLDVQPGEMIALVGPSGAGKTTLCNLIARFFDITGGSIALDGVDLRDITLESYRRLLSIVEQDTFLFDGTIAQNISYGRRHASQAEIESAARLANAHEFIEKLKDGYLSVIGERGVKLSGGQRQRLTIARAILADPKILILDEATSNLDTESERLIQGSLGALMNGRTCFVIAHRLSTIQHADRIIVIEGGKIVEQGKHEELMNRDGRYREMIVLQTSPPQIKKEAVSPKKREPEMATE